MDWKRFFDLLLSVLALTMLSPVLLTVMTILKLTGEHRVFFLQRRVGRHGKHFSVIKFTTMYQGEHCLDGAVKSDRILPLGKFLRAAKIDELPQLINVVKGDMSIIGPRPLMGESFQFYPSAFQHIITKVRPGISGLGSIVFRNEANAIRKTSLNFTRCYSKLMAYKGELEVWYVTHWNLWLDIKLVILTGLVLLCVPVKIEFWFRNLPKMSRRIRTILHWRPPSRIGRLRLRFTRSEPSRRLD